MLCVQYWALARIKGKIQDFDACLLLHSFYDSRPKYTLKIEEIIRNFY